MSLSETPATQPTARQGAPLDDGRSRGPRISLYMKVLAACAVMMLAVYAIIPFFVIRAEQADIVQMMQSDRLPTVEEALNRLAARGRMAVLISLLINGFLMLLVVLLLRMGVRPVREISEGLKSLAKGEPARPVFTRLQDEIADLANSYNLLSAELMRYREETRQHGETLERRVAERTLELADQKRFIESVVQTADFGLLTVDAGLLVTSWNTCLERILGRAGDSALGKPLTEVLPLSNREALGNDLSIVIRTGTPVSYREFETSLAGAAPGDGRYLCCDVALLPLHDSTGKTVGALMSLYDQTERKQLHMQLSQSTKLAAVGELAGGVAHEINNPLAIILGNAELLVDDLGEENPLAKQAMTIKRHALRCKEIVANLLKFAGRTQHGSGPIDVERLVVETLALLRKQLELDNVEIVEKYDGQIGMIIGSGDELQQLFFSLISNARDAMPRGGKLAVETRRNAGFVEISLTDTGAGIPKDIMDRVFSPFFTTKDPGKGTGLGLAIAHTIAMKHGGNITLQSEVGKGTGALVRLPLGSEPKPAPKAAEVTIPAAAPAAGTRRPMRVMLIDDEAGIRMVCREALERLRHEVVECEDGFEALQKVHDGRYDLILLDLKMPRMNGAETLIKIREHDQTTPVLIMTGLIDEEMLGSIPPGAYAGILKKPFQISELKGWVNRLDSAKAD